MSRLDTNANQAAQAREAVWRKAERDILRRERVRLIQNGTITPVHRVGPSVMVKDKDGRWWPNSNFVGEAP